MTETTIIASMIGLFIGSTLALTGAGGAVLSIPLLILLLDLEFQQAAPLALIMVFTASVFGSLQGLRHKIVRYKAALFIASIGSLFTPLGVSAAQQIPPHLLTTGLSLILLYVGNKAWMQASNHSQDNFNAPPPCAINPVTSKLFWNASCTKHLIGIGSLTGFLSGLLGVGGGFLIVPALKKVTNLQHASVIATTLSITALIAVSALVSYAQHSHIQWAIAAPLAGSTIIAILTTGYFSKHIPVRLSQQYFAILCWLGALSLFSPYFI